MEEEQYLKEKILEAQNHSPGTIAHRQVLDNIARTILKSKRLYRPPMGRLPPQCRGAYAEIYNTAKQELMVWVCQNLDKYDPSKASVMGWINMLLDRRFINVGIKQWQDGREKRLGKRLNLQDLIKAEEGIPSPEKETTNLDILRQFIIDDPEGLLQSRHIQKRPDVTFQLLLLYKLDDRTFKSISQELGIPIPTLNSFYRRSLNDLLPYFQKHLRY